MTPDPFAALGIEPSFDLDLAALEATYLRRSREAHPDHAASAGLSAAELADRLARAAAINDAFRILSDPWRRARALIDRLDATAIERTKHLDPMFLAGAMDLAEEVAECAPAHRDALAARLRDGLAADLDVIRSALATADADAAATRLHQSRYRQKALADLGAAASTTPSSGPEPR